MRFIFFILLFASMEAKIPVDISFIVIDLKYNSRQGVKICEIQPGNVSEIYTINAPMTPKMDYYYAKDGIFVDLFHSYLSTHFNRFWLTPASFDPILASKLLKKGWHYSNELNYSTNHTLLKNIPENPSSLSHYTGLLYGRNLPYFYFKKRYPSLLLMDAAISPFANNKLAISKFLCADPESRKLKPKWNHYKKGFSQKLVDEIIKDLESEIYVIKPISSYKGCGVIIIGKTELQSTLESIFGTDSKDNPDKSYSFWALNRNEDFIVEEFVESDPVAAFRHQNRLFDGTMCLELFLIFNENKIDLHFLGGYWKLPIKSLDEEGTFTEKHKSYCKEAYYIESDLETLEEVHLQLKKSLPPFYEQLLNSD